MARTSSLAAVVVLFLTAACSVGSTQPAAAPFTPSTTAPPALRYVSLGDSYSSGGGLVGAVQPCGRAPGAYPALVTHHAGLVASFVACNGATTADVLDRSQYAGEGRQIDAVTADADVVTISIGGNDIGFGPTIRDCVLGDQPCSRLDATVVRDLAALAPRLVRLFGQIRARAPRARLIVVGYPQVVADPDRLRYQSCAGVTADEARWLREKGDALGHVVEVSAAAAGARYLDSAATFSGHEACAPDQWIEGVNLTTVEGSFHPNATGHERLAALVEDALARP